MKAQLLLLPCAALFLVSQAWPADPSAADLEGLPPERLIALVDEGSGPDAEDSRREAPTSAASGQVSPDRPDSGRAIASRGAASGAALHSSPRHREAIALELFRRREASLPAIREAAVRGTQIRRLFALELLAEMRDGAALEIAVAGLQDPDVKIQRRAATVLRRLRAPEAYEPLLLSLDSAEDQGVLKSAIAALGAIGKKEALPSLRRYLEHENASVRVNCAISLAALGSSEGFGAVLEALENPSAVDLQAAPEARRDLQAEREAAYALGYFPGPEARSRAEGVLSDPNSLWRAEAAVALARLDLVARQASDRLLFLRALARGTDPAVRRWSIDEIADLGSEEAFASLREISAESTPEGRRAAMRLLALGKGGSVR